MWKALFGAASTIGIMLFFSTNLSSAEKNLIVGAICSVVMIFYIITGRNKSPLALHEIVLAAPTVVFVLLLLINFFMNWHIHTLVLWLCYAVLTFLAFVVSAKLEDR